jgi:hypothetical protein
VIIVIFMNWPVLLLKLPLFIRARPPVKLYYVKINMLHYYFLHTGQRMSAAAAPGTTTTTYRGVEVQFCSSREKVSHYE